MNEKAQNTFYNDLICILCPQSNRAQIFGSSQISNFHSRLLLPSVVSFSFFHFLCFFFPRLLLKHDKHFPFSISALSMKKSLLVWILFCCLKKLNAAFNGVAASSYLQHREGPPQAFSSNLIVIKTHKINFLSRAKQILVTYASRDKATLPSKKCNKFLIFLFTLMCCWKTKYDTGRNGAVIHQNPWETYHQFTRFHLRFVRVSPTSRTTSLGNALRNFLLLRLTIKKLFVFEKLSSSS